MKLSAFLIVLNEEARLERCLAMLKFADEIIVVDGGSRDRTKEIAAKSTDKIFVRFFDNFAAQKNYAAEKTTGDWLLSVDADECVSSALASEIRRVVHGDAEERVSAYAIRRQTRLFGRLFHFSGLQNDKPVRLFRKQKARFKNAVHEVLEVDGNTGVLKQPLLHDSFQTMNDYWRRLQDYTSLEAVHRQAPAKPGRFFLRPLIRFLSLYVGNQGFRDGREGFFYAALSSYYEFVRWTKVWEKEAERE